MFHGYLRTIALSWHDCGWETFPADKNPFMGWGSRYVFGYGMLLAPAIPIFMSGDEWDATYMPLPRLCPDLYGKGTPGKGRWLYGAMLQWDELKKPRHAQMLADVTKLLTIRRENSDLIYARGDDPLRKDDSRRIGPVPTSEKLPDVPVPVVIWNQHKAIVVAANPNPSESLELTLELPLAQLGWEKVQQIKVSDLWSDGADTVHPMQDVCLLKSGYGRTKLRAEE